MNEPTDRVLMTGNEALAEAAIRAGLEAYFGYPITPQNELTGYLAAHLPPLGRVFVQSESELAAINMVFGASATGARTMTTSSSPGISLMQEGLSYLAGAELPAVVANIMRGGPGLGNIQPSQADYFQATRGGGHGDYRLIVLAPATVQETADLTMTAFDLADRYRMTVMILSDGVLGQMMEPVRFREYHRPELPPKDWAVTGAQGRPQNIVRTLWLAEGMLEQRNQLLQAKYRRVEANEVRVEAGQIEDADYVIVAYGLMARAARAAVHRLRAGGVKAGWIRPISLWPFPSEIIGRVAQQPRVFLTVEMSCGQMVQDVRLAVGGQCPVLFYGRAGGGIPTVDEIVGQVEKLALPAGGPR